MREIIEISKFQDDNNENAEIGVISGKEDGGPPGSNKRLEEWKTGIENDFIQWLRELSGPVSCEQPDEDPDLYSFYEELCAVRNEIRKGGRRSQDVLTRFGDSLSDFQKRLNDLQERFIQSDDTAKELEFFSKNQLFLPLADLFERLERLKKRLKVHPKRTLFKNHNHWMRYWDKFGKGFEITLSYLETMLKKEGIEKIKTVGNPFDPSVMNAVAVLRTDRYPPDMVVQEISSGFIRNEKIIKLAKVRISKPRTGSKT